MKLPATFTEQELQPYLIGGEDFDVELWLSIEAELEAQGKLVPQPNIDDQLDSDGNPYRADFVDPPACARNRRAIMAEYFRRTAN